MPMETNNMTTKKVLLALAATGLLAFGAPAPSLAQDDPPATDDGSSMDVPNDPDSSYPDDPMPDPGTDEGATDDSANDDSAMDQGMPQGDGSEQPQ